MRVVVHRREEQDRDVPGALALLDVPGRLEAVHAGHVRVEQDHRVVLGEQPLERVLPARDGHDLHRRAPPGWPAAPAGSPAGRRRRARGDGPVIGATRRGRRGRRDPVGHEGEQLVEVDGLRDVLGGARGEARFPVAGHGLRGEEHHRQLPAAGQLADPPRGLVAVEVGHHRVHQHDVHLGVLGEEADPGRPVVGVEHGEPVQLQRAGEREDVAHVVVDDQHGGARERGRGRGRAQRGAAQRRGRGQRARHRPGPGPGHRDGRRARDAVPRGQLVRHAAA